MAARFAAARLALALSLALAAGCGGSAAPGPAPGDSNPAPSWRDLFSGNGPGFPWEEYLSGFPPRIYAGASHNCALSSDGKARCWGDAAGGKLALDGARGVADLALGEKFSCALIEDGDLRCSGIDASLSPGEKAVRLSSGAGTVCALLADGRVRCWGDVAPSIPDGTVASAIAVGDTHACAVVPGGSVRCWGSRLFGESTPPPLDPSPAIQSISAGFHQTCVSFESGPPRCWGLRSNFASLFPGMSLRAVSLGAGGGLCAISTQGEARCLDSNLDPIPGAPAATTTAVAVAAGRSHGCAVLSSRKITCWGADSSGQTQVPAELAPVSNP